MTHTRPNVIWVIADQFRGQAMGHRGDPNVSTPNLDRLAYEGTHFPAATSGTPLCTPARASFLTSLYPHESSAPTHNSPLDPDKPTIATVLEGDGYRTCWIGKWHLDGGIDHGERYRVVPAGRRGGFRDWFGFEINNRPFNTWINVDIDGEATVKHLPGFQTDVLTDVLLEWLADAGAHDDPFFAVLSVEPPHNPCVAPAEDMARHRPADVVFRDNVPDVARVRDLAAVELAGYYAAIENLDANVGRIRDRLDELGLREDTYIMVFSDHGDMGGSHGQFRKSAPWEEAIRVPFIVGGPTQEHQWYEKARADSVLNHVDVAPTTLGLCGVAVPEWMRGYDYSGRLRLRGPDPLNLAGAGREAEPRSAYLSLPVPSGHADSIDRPYRGVVTVDGWKYVCLEGQPWLMFDLNEDPYEQVNLAFNLAFAEKRRELHEELAAWIERTDDRFELPVLA